MLAGMLVWSLTAVALVACGDDENEGKAQDKMEALYVI